MGADWLLRDTAQPSGFGDLPKDVSYTPGVPLVPPVSCRDCQSPSVVWYPSGNGCKQHTGVSTALSQHSQMIKGGQSWCSPEILGFFGLYNTDGKARIWDVNYEVPAQPSALRALSLRSISPGSQKAEYTTHETHSSCLCLRASSPAGMGIYSGNATQDGPAGWEPVEMGDENISKSQGGPSARLPVVFPL